jgi:hypothetical protein
MVIYSVDEARRIQADNFALSRRITSTPHYYDVHRWDAQYDQHTAAVLNLSKHKDARVRHARREQRAIRKAQRDSIADKQRSLMPPNGVVPDADGTIVLHTPQPQSQTQQSQTMPRARREHAAGWTDVQITVAEDRALGNPPNGTSFSATAPLPSTSHHRISSDDDGSDGSVPGPEWYSKHDIGSDGGSDIDAGGGHDSKMKVSLSLSSSTPLWLVGGGRHLVEPVTEVDEGSARSDALRTGTAVSDRPISSQSGMVSPNIMSGSASPLPPRASTSPMAASSRLGSAGSSTGGLSRSPSRRTDSASRRHPKAREYEWDRHQQSIYGATSSITNAVTSSTLGSLSPTSIAAQQQQRAMGQSASVPVLPTRKANKSSNANRTMNSSSSVIWDVAPANSGGGGKKSKVSASAIAAASSTVPFGKRRDQSAPLSSQYSVDMFRNAFGVDANGNSSSSSNGGNSNGNGLQQLGMLSWTDDLAALLAEENAADVRARPSPDEADERLYQLLLGHQPQYRTQPSATASAPVATTPSGRTLPAIEPKRR